MPRTWMGVLLLAALGSGCQVFQTNGGEQVAGRGARAFDPYQGPSSGSIRLALQEVDGCAVLASGAPVGKGDAPIPYPDHCNRPAYLGPSDAAPTPMLILSGADYFLNQITLMDEVTDVHTDASQLDAVARWMREDSRFKDLDWGGLTVASDQWIPSEETFAPGYFAHRVLFGNAAWMTATDDTFTVEVLDRSGAVRQSITYARSEFLSSAAPAGHTQVGWAQENVGAPDQPGGAPTAPPPVPPGFPPASPEATHSFVRLEWLGSTHPTKTFRIDSSLTGDGAIRLTWSLQPNSPHYFPVRMVRPDELPLRCFNAQDPSQRVACSQGLEPEVKLSAPANGQYYQPGERFELRVAVKDGRGNLIHDPAFLPSWNESVRGEGNGLLYLNTYTLGTLRERDTISALKIAGPRQAMRPYYDRGGSPYYQSPGSKMMADAPEYGDDGADTLVPGALIAGSVPGGRDVHPSTTFDFTLPKDAQPGTYDVYFKVNRQFLGERFAKTIAVPFQVGQPEPTTYPGRIGNCQMCHRGVLSLDNLRHGLPVDDVEGCKACHSRDQLNGGRHNTLNAIHEVHFQSSRYALPKNDCTACHLTRESATRPSFVVCASCHPSVHGGSYWNTQISSDAEQDITRSAYANCAATCHQATPPALHHLPPQ